MAARPDINGVSLYDQGSSVYRLDAEGEMESIVAWVRSSVVAARAFDALVYHYPAESFSQRRRAVIENERIAPAGPDRAVSTRTLVRSAETVAEHIAGGYSIRAYCERGGEPLCGHSVELDLEALGNRLGFEHHCTHDALAPKLRCSSCGSRNVSLRISPKAGLAASR